jgi:aminomethyltransferase
VAVIDLSALRKFEVVGPDAEALLDYAVTRDVTRLSAGQVVYTALCYPHGGMLDDGTVFRMGPQQFRIVCGDPYVGEHLRELASSRGLDAWVRSSTDQLHNIAVQGPHSRELLAKIVVTPPTQPSVEELGWFRFTIGRLGSASGPAVVVSRTGYSGELGYEVWCHPRDGVTLWDEVFAAGKPLGVMPMGLEALDMLRIEAGLIFANYEFTDETDPFEAGIGFTVPLASKKGDFLGREALQRRKAQPLRKLVGLEIDGREPAHHGDHVYVGRARVGVVTSGMRSPVLDKTIALARLDVSAAALDTAVEIGKLDGHQKRLKARVVRFAHYDPDKTRVRA